MVRGAAVWITIWIERKGPRMPHRHVVPFTGIDPVIADAKHYRVQFETDRVRVLRVNYGPHEKSVLHGHPPGIAVYLTDAHLRFTYRDGRAEEGHVKAGAAVPTALEEHIPENLGDMPVEIILIELKADR
jgi:quercetin dioxygenase-like cupin family protein